MVFVALLNLISLVMFAKRNVISAVFPSLLTKLFALRTSHLLLTFFAS